MGQIERATKNGNEAAFPSSPTFNPTNSEPWRPADIGCAGMSKREEFAKCFLAGLLASPQFYSVLCGRHDESPGIMHEIAAKEAVNFADALLERLAK